MSKPLLSVALLGLVCLGVSASPVTSDVSWLAVFSHTSLSHLAWNLMLVALSSLALGMWTVPVTLVGALASVAVWATLDLPPAMGLSGGSFAAMAAAAMLLPTYWMFVVMLATLGMAVGEAGVAHGVGMVIGAILGLILRKWGNLELWRLKSEEPLPPKGPNATSAMG